MNTVAMMLLQKGADANAIDDQGKRPLEYINFQSFDQELYDKLQQLQLPLPAPIIETQEEYKETKNTEILESLFTMKSRKLSSNDDMSDVISFDADIESELKTDDIKSDRLAVESNAEVIHEIIIK
jgi:hypothetical protein